MQNYFLQQPAMAIAFNHWVAPRLSLPTASGSACAVQKKERNTDLEQRSGWSRGKECPSTGLMRNFPPRQGGQCGRALTLE